MQKKKRRRMSGPAKGVLLLGAALLLAEAIALAYIWFTDGADALWIRHHLPLVIEHMLAAVLVTVGGALLLDYALFREGRK